MRELVVYKRVTVESSSSLKIHDKTWYTRYMAEKEFPADEISEYRMFIPETEEEYQQMEQVRKK